MQSKRTKPSIPLLKVKTFLRFPLGTAGVRENIQTLQLFLLFEKDVLGRIRKNGARKKTAKTDIPQSLFGPCNPMLKNLFNMAKGGSKVAAKAIWSLGCDASWAVAILEGMCPRIMREIARENVTWPVVASTQPGWEHDTDARLIALELGQGRLDIDIPFRKRQRNENYPARKWAKDATNCINGTRILTRALSSLGTMAGDNLWRGRWKREDAPVWASNAAALPEFSSTTLPKWKPVIREMIREQVQDFELQQDWERKRNACKLSGRATKGEIRNAILDDIVDALKTLAPRS